MDLIVIARTYRHVGDSGAAAEKGGASGNTWRIWTGLVSRGRKHFILN